MKKILMSLAAIAICVAATNAQTPEITEPDFIGEVLTIMPDGSTVMLEKETVQLRTRANASALITGIGKAKTKLIVESPSAAVKLKNADVIQFIIRNVDNASDPISIINIFRFDCSNTKRLAEMSSVSSFGSVKQGNLQKLKFTARKYGTSSYLITLTDKPVGEFGITVNNPNNIDEKQVIVSTFAIE